MRWLVVLLLVVPVIPAFGQSAADQLEYARGRLSETEKELAEVRKNLEQARKDHSATEQKIVSGTLISRAEHKLRAEVGEAYRRVDHALEKMDPTSFAWALVGFADRRTLRHLASQPQALVTPILRLREARDLERKQDEKIRRTGVFLGPDQPVIHPGGLSGLRRMAVAWRRKLVKVLRPNLQIYEARTVYYEGQERGLLQEVARLRDEIRNLEGAPGTEEIAPPVPEPLPVDPAAVRPPVVEISAVSAEKAELVGTAPNRIRVHRFFLRCRLRSGPPAVLRLADLRLDPTRQVRNPRELAGLSFPTRTVPRHTVRIGETVRVGLTGTERGNAHATGREVVVGPFHLTTWENSGFRGSFVAAFEVLDDDGRRHGRQEVRFDPPPEDLGLTIEVLAPKWPEGWARDEGRLFVKAQLSKRLFDRLKGAQRMRVEVQPTGRTFWLWGMERFGPCTFQGYFPTPPGRVTLTLSTPEIPDVQPLRFSLTTRRLTYSEYDRKRFDYAAKTVSERIERIRSQASRGLQNLIPDSRSVLNCYLSEMAEIHMKYGELEQALGVIQAGEKNLKAWGQPPDDYDDLRFTLRHYSAMWAYGQATASPQVVVRAAESQVRLRQQWAEHRRRKGDPPQEWASDLWKAANSLSNAAEALLHLGVPFAEAKGLFRRAQVLEATARRNGFQQSFGDLAIALEWHH